MREHLRRLERVWVDAPIFFITTCTFARRKLLASPKAAGILIDEWAAARERHGWVIGRYVVMPDHVHFFASPQRDAKDLPLFVGAWKRWTSRRTKEESAATVRPLWQPEFFDHLLRSTDSYDAKWDYVRQNPVRAGLVNTADD